MSDTTMAPATPRLLTIQQVAKRFGVSVRTIWRWEAAKRIPRGVRLTSATVRWWEDDIERHVSSFKS
jgi:predicted DNA-binding transcriptional regulator AlpA